jgi:hypothetical protein
MVLAHFGRWLIAPGAMRGCISLAHKVGGRVFYRLPLYAESSMGWWVARKWGDLALDSDDLAALNRFDACEASGHERQQVLQAVRLRTENDNRELAGG